MERIDKRIILGVLLIALLTSLIVMPIPGCKPGPEIPAISNDQAIAILVSEIIDPATEYKGISAFMLSEPLQNGDVVTSESGEDYPIDDSTWFIFIDADPRARFAHGCRYVFIDGETGSYDVIDETWPPEINNLSMWDTQNLGRGNIIELYSVLDSAVPIVGSPSQAPAGDYGDAPDGQDAYYGVPGRYPTLFNTANSQFSRPGGHTLNVGEETLGMSVSAEVDANDPADPDGVPNLVDADSDERISVIVEGTQAKLAFTVTVAPNAPDVTRYANALIDFDQSGNWSAGTYGTEWVLVNLELDVDPGSSETVITPWFSWGNQSVLPSPVWMRLLLAREEVDEALFANVGGWDGSGQFLYGEIEDYFVFLTDVPPTPDVAPWWEWWQPWSGFSPLGQPPQEEHPKPEPPEAQPPGPEEGPCGYNITYYSIIINGGDNKDDLKKGETIMKADADTMANLTSAQNYTSIANLGPGNNTVARNNTLSAINQTFNWLAGNVTCGDRVLIYITGHGDNNGIGLSNATGETQEILRPKDPAADDGKDNTLADFLKKIPCCPNEDCDTAGKCCNITVIIDCCYAGTFNVTGVTGECRTVIGTSNNTATYGYASGGDYTRGFDNDSRNATSDRNRDGFVSPAEAHVTAVEEVEKENKKCGTNQTPWISPGSNCTCKCAGNASIDVEKWIWYELYGTWVDEIEVLPGALVAFVLEIESDGKDRDIVDLEIIDFLPYCLVFDYEFTPILYYNDMAYFTPPDTMTQVEGGVELYWNLAEIGPLAPGESIAIEYYAYAEYPGENINILYGTAHCAVDSSKVVSDEDTATVMVATPEIPPEEVLSVGFKAYAECTFLEEVCSGCDVTISFWAEDISSGDIYPVTDVVLRLDGVPWFESGPISTGYLEDVVEREADCGQTIEIEIIAMNLIGLEAIAVDSITTPSHP